MSAIGRHVIIGAAGALALAMALANIPITYAAPGSAQDAPVITAAPDAHISFPRTAVKTVASTPDEKLTLVLASADPEAQPAADATLSGPMDVLTHTSSFGHRASPIHGASEFHRGQDFAGACGTNVRASAGGTVVFAGWHPYGGGNRVELEHSSGLKTTYNHLASISVSDGQQVPRGQVIAGVGTTGASTGCHLHFEVELRGEVVDPMAWL